MAADRCQANGGSRSLDTANQRHGLQLHAVAAADTNTASAVGDDGTILRTADGGATWRLQTSRTDEDLMSVAAVDAETAWAVGSGGAILKTTDGGLHWAALPGVGVGVYGVAACGPDGVYVVGNGGAIYRSGATPVLAPTPSPAAAPTPAVVPTAPANSQPSVAGGTHKVTSGAGSPCNYEFTRDEQDIATLSGPIDETFSLAGPDRLSVQLGVLVDPQGTVTVQLIDRNYGGQSCTTEINQRQYAFGDLVPRVDGGFGVLDATMWLGTVMLLDVVVVAALVERSLAMFQTRMGTWIPFVLLYLSTITVGQFSATRRGERRHRAA